MHLKKDPAQPRKKIPVHHDPELLWKANKLLGKLDEKHPSKYNSKVVVIDFNRPKIGCCGNSKLIRVRLLVTSWTITHQGPLSMRFSRQEYCSRLLCPPPGDLLNPEISYVSCIGQVGSLHQRHLGSPPNCCSVTKSCCVWLFATPWTAACRASLSFTISWSLLKLMSIESILPSNHLILCCVLVLLLLPSIFPIIRVFSNESALHIR